MNYPIEQLRVILEAYPGKDTELSTLEAVDLALHRLAVGKGGVKKRDPYGWLLGRVRAFSFEVGMLFGPSPDELPSPSAWFNTAQYLREPEAVMREPPGNVADEATPARVMHREEEEGFMGHCPHEQIQDYWNMRRGAPRCTKMTTARKRKLQARWGEPGFRDQWKDSIDRVAEARGCNSGFGWVANFDWWVLNDTNWLKVLEGNYDASNKPVTDDDRRARSEKVAMDQAEVERDKGRKQEKLRQKADTKSKKDQLAAFAKLPEKELADLAELAILNMNDFCRAQVGAMRDPTKSRTLRLEMWKIMQN